MKTKQLLKSAVATFAVTAGLFFTPSSAFAQIKVGDNPSVINPDAVLDIESTTKGILYPRVALVTPTSPAPLSAHVEGMYVHNTASNADVEPGTYYNDGTQWVKLVTATNATQVFGAGAPSGSCAAGTMYTDTLESSPTLGQQWTCSGGIWKSYKAPNSTPFYNLGTTNDAGANKGSWIERNGGITLRPTTDVSRTALTNDGFLRLYRSGATYPNYGGYIDLTNSIASGQTFKFRVAMRTDFGGGNGALSLQTFNIPRLVVASSGRVGINSTDPERTLHVVGGIRGTAEGVTGSLAQGTATRDGYEFNYDPNNDNTFGYIQSSGFGANLSLSKKAGAALNDRFQAFWVNNILVGEIVRIAGGIDYQNSSDRRLKENIKPTRYTLDDVMKIDVVEYNLKSEGPKMRTIGFIAQDLHKVYPEAVTVGGENEKTNPWTVGYAKLTPLLVKAIQDQQKEIVSLKEQLSEMNALKAQVAETNALKAEVAGIKAMLSQMEAGKATEAK